MEFTLFYRGQLKANGNANEKHLIRVHFHKQFKELWEQRPLCNVRKKMLDKANKDQSMNVLIKIRDYEFAPLVCAKTALIAELDVTLLRPEPPGAIILKSGDIDNRLKTLFDSLKVPDSPGELPDNVVPASDETPFFCLLEDDSLITKVKVSTDRLLETNIDPSEAVVQIHVTIKRIEVLWGTIGLG